MMKESWIFRRGDLYLADLGNPSGSIQGGIRPVVVIQNNMGNAHSPTLTIIPLTSKVEKKKTQPSHYLIRKAKGLMRPSMAQAEQITTINKTDVIRYIGRLSAGQMLGIEKIIKNQALNEIRHKH